jgi:hypothetical protein
MPDCLPSPLKLRPHRHVLATITEQGGMLLDLRGRGRWFALTPSAALWWQHLEAGATPAEAAGAIAKRYRITTERASADLQPFVQALLHRGMIELVRENRRWWPW